MAVRDRHGITATDACGAGEGLTADIGRVRLTALSRRREQPGPWRGGAVEADAAVRDCKHVTVGSARVLGIPEAGAVGES
ncbi:hypothetical protein TUSST3_14780 [Streptomyces sp. TUS-ST3]|nr:hypothetical protein TUSST3_14780 [Streptomyces sp. TUS-ST3]